jgi:hypothetical protein
MLRLRAFRNRSVADARSTDDAIAVMLAVIFIPLLIAHFFAERF